MTTGTATTGDGQMLKDANPFRYSGYYYDAETGFYYLKSRYYSPNLGRFISKDLIPSRNDYAYCENNPVNLVDPDGLEPSLLNRFSNSFTNVVIRPISNALDPGPTTWGAVKSTGKAVAYTFGFVALKGYAMVNTIGAVTGASLYGSKIVEVSNKSMHQLGKHYNKWGRGMGYASKKEYDAAAKAFARKYQGHSGAKVFEGIWNGPGQLNGTTQRAIIYNGKTVILNKASGQVIDFYTGTGLKGLIKLKEIK